MEENCEKRKKSIGDQDSMLSEDEEIPSVTEMKDPLLTYAAVCEKGLSTHVDKIENKFTKIDSSSSSAFVTSMRSLEENGLTKENCKEDTIVESTSNYGTLTQTNISSPLPRQISANDSAKLANKSENKSAKIDTSSASAFVASVRSLEKIGIIEESFKEGAPKEQDSDSNISTEKNIKSVTIEPISPKDNAPSVPSDKSENISPEIKRPHASVATSFVNTDSNGKRYQGESSAFAAMNETSFSGHMQNFVSIKPAYENAVKINGTGRNQNSDLSPSLNFNDKTDKIPISILHENEDPYETSWPTEREICSILDKLQLSPYRKQKLTLEKVKEFSMCKPSGAKGSSEAVSKFFHKLMHNSVEARNEIMFEKSNMEHNSMDLMYCFLLIADDFLRQEIFSRLAVLQFSVPFLIKDPSTKYLLLNWSLVNITKRWKTLNGKSFIESDVHSGNFVYCSFVRIGDLSFSKSKVINKLFPKGNEPFQNYDEDDVPRTFSSGSLELSWLLPVRDENFEPLATVNLRGDSKNNIDLAMYVAKQSSVLCVFIGNTSVETERLLISLAKFCSMMIVISDKKLNADDLVKGLPKKTNFVYIRDTESRIIQKLKPLVLNKKLKKKNFSEWEEGAKAFDFLLEDSNECMQVAKEAALTLAKEIGRNKLSSLPLSGKLWKDYNAIHKRQKRVTEKPTDISVKKYTELLEQNKRKIRTQQGTLMPAKFFEHFAERLILNQKERRYFLFWLSQYLERFSRDPASSKEIGIEHLMRELCQIYMLHISNDSPSNKSSLARILKQNDANIEVSFQHTMIDVLLAGHPIELFDGDAQGIPDLFFVDFMRALEDRMGKRNSIGVVSVLGVQSSGKSTLLNAMFGCKFTVSSGRCTKGVNLQLITVQKQYAAKFNIDYILVLDTEGLKSPERQDLMGNDEHDSELATFVVGLSDIVVLNVASESMDALKDIIQITIHAFLRMKDVNYQKTKCLFVHQNTGDPSNHQKLTNERKLFEKTLKELTEIAAKSEIGTTQVCFKDILDYDEDKSHEYFCCLYDGTPPMAAINQGYAEKVMSVKESILLSLSKNQRQTPSSFSKKVLQIWDAVLSEDFLYSFKNSFIAFKRGALDDKFAELEWEFRQELKKHLEIYQTEISNSKELLSLQVYVQRLEGVFDDIPERMLHEMEEYLKDDPVSKRLFFEEVKSSVDHLMIKTKTELLESLKDSIEREKSKRVVASKELGFEMFFKGRIASLGERFRSEGKSLDENEATAEFDKLWDHLLSDIGDHSFRRIERTNFEMQVREYLMQKYSKRYGKCLKSELKNKESLAEFAREQIDISSLYDEKSYWTRLKNFGASYFSSRQQLPVDHIDHYHTTNRLAVNLIKSFENDIERALGNKDLCFENWYSVMVQLHHDLNISFENPMYHLFNNNMVARAKITLHIFGAFVQYLDKFRETFLENNDPVRKIARRKDHFRNFFLDLCASRSLASTAAGRFIEDCYIPGITETIEISIDRVLAAQFKSANTEFTNRKTCEIALLRDTHDTGDFNFYLKLIHQYKKHLEDWLHFKMTKYFKKPCPCETCSRYNRNIFSHVIFERTDSLNQSIWIALEDIVGGPKSDINVLEVLQKISDASKQNVILKMETMKPYLNLTTGHEFALILMKELERFQDDNFTEKKKWIDRAVLYLIESLIGCGTCCPFCGAPCSLSSSQHDEHSTNFHRPQVIVGYSYEGSNDAMIENCPAYLAKGTSFRNQDSRWQFVSYKDYKTIYPNWNIMPSLSIESGIFWKWVLVEKACEFELYYGFNSNSIPTEWRDITWESVERDFESQLQKIGEDEGEESE
ncbi:interferon-induced very large GTPase 1-like [Artemia franciscana]|uniref:interferon-induced very large GTPase 1-like n=1 Tax=Artemia franciscana TaxID=6661 RepID=UPI0032DA1570